MARRAAIAIVLVAAIGIVSINTLGCDFQFSYSSISAPIGTSGEVGIRVYKDHNNCTLPNPYDYDITVLGVQVLSETAWEEIEPNVIEKWIVVSLAEEGEGYVMISKTCTKEGYEEARMPVTASVPTEDGVWAQAWSGTYPFALSEGYEVLFAVGVPVLADAVLTVDGRSMTLPEVPPMLAALTTTAAVFYTTSGDALLPLLIVGQDLFWRYDHFLGT
jgi:hypothetical protein